MTDLYESMTKLRRELEGMIDGDSPANDAKVTQMIEMLDAMPRLPLKPTMGMWDDFCSVYKVPFEDFKNACQAMLDGLPREYVIREGFQLVPVEPTDAMLDAMNDIHGDGGGYDKIYKAALDAARSCEGESK